MTPFPCTGCGACCRQVGRVLRAHTERPAAFPPIVAAALATFPYGTTPQGWCEQLQPDGRCGVYADRPLVCRVDEMGALRGEEPEETHATNARQCDALQEAEGLGPKWKVPR